RAVGQDGTWRAISRPAGIVAMSRRMYAWRSSQEFCARCAKPATAIVNQTSYCATCRFEQRQRAAEALPWHGRSARRPELRGTEQPIITGHPIVFDSRSLDLGGFFEYIRPEAVDRTIHESTDLLALWNHNADVPLGRSTGGTLAYWKDGKGLAMSITTPRSAGAVVESIELRTVTGGSFAFRTVDDAWHMEDEIPIREILDMKISELSPVAFPAYPGTDVQVGKSGKHSREWWERLHRTQLAR